MTRLPVRILSIALGAGLSPALAAGCGSSEDSPAGAKTLSFELTDAGCNPHDAKAPAGPITFEVEGASSSVTELEVLDGETILGEKENITEGLSGSFSLTLEEGEYTLRCNGGSEEDGTLTITGGVAAKADPEAEAAVDQYRKYLEKNTTELVATTASFTAAVEAGERRGSQSPLRAGPHPLRADRAGGRELRRPRPAHRRPRKRRREERIRRLPPDRESALAGRHDQGHDARTPRSCSKTSPNCRKR